MKLIILPDKKCEQCGAWFNRSVLPCGRREAIEDFKVRKFCGRECWDTFHVGPNCWNFKPEGSISSEGYVRISVAGERKYLHRVVMEKVLGRPLATSEHVHHVDENKQHNVSENFEVHSNSNHRKHHCKNQKRGPNGKFE